MNRYRLAPLAELDLEEIWLSATDAHDGVQVEVPSDVAPGDWQLSIGTNDGFPLRKLITVRVR